MGEKICGENIVGESMWGIFWCFFFVGTFVVYFSSFFFDEKLNPIMETNNLAIFNFAFKKN